MEYLKKAAVRPAQEAQACSRQVAEIIARVREMGDEALREYNLRFDGNGREQLRVTREEIDAAYASMTPQELEDLRRAADNIRAFAQAQRECLNGLDNFSNLSGQCWDTGLSPWSPVGVMWPGALTPSFPPH